MEKISDNTKLKIEKILAIVLHIPFALATCFLSYMVIITYKTDAFIHFFAFFILWVSYFASAVIFCFNVARQKEISF